MPGNETPAFLLARVLTDRAAAIGHGGVRSQGWGAQPGESVGVFGRAREPG